MVSCKQSAATPNNFVLMAFDVYLHKSNVHKTQIVKTRNINYEALRCLGRQYGEIVTWMKSTPSVHCYISANGTRSVSRLFPLESAI